LISKSSIPNPPAAQPDLRKNRFAQRVFPVLGPAGFRKWSGSMPANRFKTAAVVSATSARNQGALHQLIRRSHHYINLFFNIRVCWRKTLWHIRNPIMCIGVGLPL
jgi:hypothetical protein